MAPRRPSSAAGSASLALAAAVLSAVVAACGDSTTSPRPPAEVSVVFVDQTRRLYTIHSGGERAATPLQNVVPLAAHAGKVAYLAPRVVDFVNGHRFVVDSGGLRLYSVADGSVDTLRLRGARLSSAAAIAPDGRTIAYSTVARDSAFVVSLDLQTGLGDSANLSARIDQPAAVQAILSTPVFAPDGERVAFLLPNQIGMQLMLYEVRTHRVEVFPIRIPTTTVYAPLSGWPRWTRDGSIRFLTRRRESPETLTDTLVVLKIFPGEPTRPASEAYKAHPPAGVAVSSIDEYSFDADGNTVAFGVLTGSGKGLFLIRNGAAEFEELVYEPGLTPLLPLLVP
jgi:hypothetical protein